MKMINTLLTILAFLLSSVSFSQDLKQKIESLPIYNHSGCDTINNKKIATYRLGELPLKIDIENVKTNDDKIIMIGYVLDKQTGEPLANSQIFTATFQNNYCEIIEKLTETDLNGKFEIEFKNSLELSLYFTSLSYVGLEIKIGNLKL